MYQYQYAQILVTRSKFVILDIEGHPNISFASFYENPFQNYVFFCFCFFNQFISLLL